MTDEEFHHWKTGFLMAAGTPNARQDAKLAAMAALVDGRDTGFAAFVREHWPPGLPVSYAIPASRLWEAAGAAAAQTLA